MHSDNNTALNLWDKKTTTLRITLPYVTVTDAEST